MNAYEKKMIGVMLAVYVTAGIPMLVALVATFAK